ncbi:MAG: putative sugar nucleotidyl transferase [Bacteroidia bacterium]
MEVGLFEDAHVQDFYPLTRVLPFWELRVGLGTFLEKFARRIADSSSVYLWSRWEKVLPSHNQPILWLNTRLKLHKNTPLWDNLSTLESAVYVTDGQLVAFWASAEKVASLSFPPNIENLPGKIHSLSASLWQRPHELFSEAHAVLQADWTGFPLRSVSFPPYVTALGKDNIFVAEGATILPCILNAQEGPIYIGAGATIQEGAIVQHSNVIEAHATVLLGAKIRTRNVIGPHCKVGGEVENSLFLAFSNKAHDGFLGNSLVGRWCNLGAGTISSNLKNTYGLVRLYNPYRRCYEETGLQFCGSVIGDYVKTGIQTMLTTGTVLDVGAHFWGSGFTPKYLPPFAWGVSGRRWKWEAFVRAVQRMMDRRGQRLSDTEKEILEEIYRSSG